MPGKTNKKPAEGEEELGDDVLSVIGAELEEDVTDDEELDVAIAEEFEEDF